MVRRQQLKAADVAILEHIARYHLTTATILSSALDYEESDAGTALQRLTETGALVSTRLAPEGDATVCYQLTPWAAEQLGCEAAFARPLAREARLECFAIAQFCCRGDVFRQLYTKTEFIDKFRAIWHPGQPVRYYLEPSESDRPRLAFLKVDTHGTGQWDRLIDGCAKFLHKRIDVPHAKPAFRSQVAAFAELVRQGRFQFSILTALPEKQRAIEIELDRRQGAGLTVPPISVYVVPSLWEIIVPPVVANLVS